MAWSLLSILWLLMLSERISPTKKPATMAWTPRNSKKMVTAMVTMSMNWNSSSNFMRSLLEKNRFSALGRSHFRNKAEMMTTTMKMGRGKKVVGSLD